MKSKYPAGVNKNDLRLVYAKQAIKFDKKSDVNLWKSALFCSRIVGQSKKGDGATKSLAEDMNRSPDTIEDRAHAYIIFEKMCNLYNGEHRLYVFNARRASFIHFSHFRALWDAQKKFELSDEQVFDLLVDIVQSDGDISSRNLSDHIQTRFGKQKSWLYHAERIGKEITNLLNHPDTPKEIRKTLQEIIKILPIHSNK